jgi:lipoprotein-anchoring transpeptidase ErfK/SrfK
MLAAVRRAILVTCAVVAWSPGAQAAAPRLTLRAPAATTYLHTIDFVGRLSPPAKDARVRLVRAAKLVAVGRVRGDGTFVIPVRIANPGPFRVVWSHASSPSVTVRIRPRLDARLVGSGVAGAPLRLVASLQPAAAGRVRVQVIRAGSIAFDRSFPGQARVALGTARPGSLLVRLRALPRPGFEPLARELAATLRPPTLAVGATNPAVAELARRLADLRYAVPSLSSTFSPDLVESVYAFQKVQELPRTGVADAALWARLDHPRLPRPRYSSPADHLEVDKAHQVLYVVRNGQISLISPVSTAGIAGYSTPEGRFAIYRKVVGYDPSPLGVLLDPLYFVGGYAIHGNPSVPPYPASHGCVRVPNFVIFRLFTSEPYGETVYVYA